MKTFGQIGLVFRIYKLKNIGGVENSIASFKEDYKRTYAYQKNPY